MNQSHKDLFYFCNQPHEKQKDFKLKNKLLAIENKALVDKIAVLEEMVYKNTM